MKRMIPLFSAVTATALFGIVFCSCQSPMKEEAAPAAAVSGSEPSPKSEWKVSASGVQEDIFPAALACDGKTDTRWSSPPTDPQWLQIDMGKPATVCGLSILWESAFASEYSILTSLDGSKWDEAYSTKTGDGQTDDFYFQPVIARFVKILCLKRGTGWGDSIWEVSVKGPAQMPVIDSPGTTQTAHLFDGRTATSWTSATHVPTSLTIDLRQEKALGGIRLDWGESYPTDFAVFFSRDGSTWSVLGEMKDGTGGFDYVLHPRFMARYLRIDLQKSALNKAIEIKEITLRGQDETINPLALYQIAAEKARPGLYPDSLRKHQVYWTIVGQPGDRAESLLDEYGNLEPLAGSCSIMPYVFTGGKLLSAFDANLVTQALDNGYLPLPSVLWDLNGLKMKVEALTAGSVDDSITYVRYTLSNGTKVAQKGKIFLAIRPVQVNPPWQYGGLSSITALEYVPGGEWPAAVKVNGVEQFLSLMPPDGFGARAFDQGDIMRSLVKGELPPAQKLDNAGDLLSGALVYEFDLKPGESKSVVVAAPLHGKKDGISSFMKRGFSDFYTADDAFTARLSDSRNAWMNLIDSVKISLPDPAIANTVKSQLAYILINRDGVAIQPGSRNYKRTWIRDGCLTSASMLRMGLVDPVRKYLDWYAESVLPDGLVPPILNNDGTVNGGFGSNLEYDSQGEFIYAIMEFYRFTGDKEFLQRHFGKVKLAMEYLAKLHERTLAPDYMKDEPARERFVGILPPSFSHEGYSPPMHSYWDDFFALKGWKDGKEAAEILGDTNTAAWAGEQYKALRHCVKASIEKTIAFKGIHYVPGCAEKGDADASSTTIAFFPCEEQDLLPAAAVAGTYDGYYSYCTGRLSPDWAGSFTPYEIRNITAFVDLGEKDRANFLLDYMMSCRRPAGWNHWGEVVLSDPRMGSYIGDMPHTWVGSGFVNVIRDMLAKERDGKLVLLEGAPEAWVREKSGIRIENLPTHFGALDMKARASGHTLTITLGGKANPPKGLEILWPISGAPGRVAVDGYKWTEFDDKACHLPAMAKEVIAEWAKE
jgi:hypothetical protein